MDPADPGAVGDRPHGFRKRFLWRHREVVVQHQDDVAVGVDGAADLLVDPVLLFLVPLTPGETTRGADQQEVPRGADIVQQTLVKLAGLQTVDIQEDGVVQQLQVDLQEAGQPRPIGPPVTDEDVQSLLQTLLTVSRPQPVQCLHGFYSFHDLDPVYLVVNSTF